MQQNQQLQQRIDQGEQQRNQQQQMDYAQREHQGNIASIRNQEEVLTKAHPDYPQAVDHLADWHMENFMLTNPGATPEQARQYIGVQANQLMVDCLRGNLNFAEVVYNLAKRAGYNGAAATIAAKLPAPNTGRQPATQQQRQRQAAGTLNALPPSGAASVALPTTKAEVLAASEAQMDAWSLLDPKWWERVQD